MKRPNYQKNKKILALDGGGVRGALSVAFLERIEWLYSEYSDTNQPLTLSSQFNLIGGTSTGAIIATLLTLGYSTADIKALYFKLATGIFQRPWYRLKLFQPVFDIQYLKTQIDQAIGSLQLDSEALQTFLAIITKRMDTGSAWIVSNNSRSKYWNDPDDGSYIGNRHYRLADLVRASTAAPYYFAPHEIGICDGEPPGQFVDGGITPHNNPALALFQVATIPAYGFGWSVGAETLRIISIGTGTYREYFSSEKIGKTPALVLAIQALKSMVKDSSNEVMTLMQILGQTDTPWRINSEVGDLKDVLLPQKPLFTFQRYDVRLEQDWLKRELGMNLTEKHVKSLTQMENYKNIPLLYEIGQMAAEKQIKPEHLGLKA
ncbi:MAG: patatin-like phospholipase family protein [Burkholderiales bacterium]|nr:patatin-like phospholipase family protein [Burkholderiales bacterium]